MGSLSVERVDFGREVVNRVEVALGLKQVEKVLELVERSVLG